MKLVPIIIGAALGLLVGWAGSHWLIGSQRAERAAKNAGSDAGDWERGSMRWLAATLRARETRREVATAKAYLSARKEERTRGGESPYRGVMREIGWLQTMPLEELLALLEAGDLRGHLEIGVAFSRWVEADPMAALEGIDRVNLQRDDRRFAQRPVYEFWARHDPLALLDRLAELEPTMERGRKAMLLFEAWKSIDTAEVAKSLGRFEALVQKSSDYERRRLRENLLKTWVGQDEEAATRWVESLQDEAERNSTRDLLELARLSHLENDEAVESLLSMSGYGVLQSRLPEFWKQWASNDPAAAVARLASLPRGENQELGRAMTVDVAKRAVISWITLDSREEAFQVLKGIREGYQRRQIVRGFVEGAAPNDPQLAARFLELLPEGEERWYTATQMVQDWTKQNLVEAGEWLVQQEPSRSRDGAATAFASALSHDDAPKAAAWADTIENPEWRAGIRETIFERWQGGDPEAAREWRDGWE